MQPELQLVRLKCLLERISSENCNFAFFAPELYVLHLLVEDLRIFEALFVLNASQCEQ